MYQIIYKTFYLCFCIYLYILKQTNMPNLRNIYFKHYRNIENVMLQDMNLSGISARDHRQLEVVANGLPLWGGGRS